MRCVADARCHEPALAQRSGIAAVAVARSARRSGLPREGAARGGLPSPTRRARAAATACRMRPLGGAALMRSRASVLSLLAAWLLVLAALGAFTMHTLRITTDLRSFMPPPQTAGPAAADGPDRRRSGFAPAAAGDHRRAAKRSWPHSSAASPQRLADDPHFVQRLDGAVDPGPRSIRPCCRIATCCRRRSMRIHSTRPTSRDAAAAARRGSRVAGGGVAQTAAAARSDPGNPGPRAALDAAETAGDRAMASGSPPTATALLLGADARRRFRPDRAGRRDRRAATARSAPCRARRARRSR